MNKKNTRIVFGMLLLVTAIALTGCGSSSTKETSSISSTSSSASGQATQSPAVKSTIEFALGKSGENSAYASKDVLDEFEKQTNIHVNIQMLPTEQVSTIMQTKLAVGEVPDLILYNLVDAAREFNLEKNFEHLDNEAWVARLTDKSVLSYKGHIYGFHLNQDAGQQGMVYNQDIFKDLGLAVPKNYNELLVVSAKIKASGITPIFMPFKDAWASNMWTGAAIADYAKKNDPKLWDDLNTHKKKWTDYPIFETITQQQLDLYIKGFTNKDVLSDSYDMALHKFLKKEVAMMAMGDWFITDAYKKDPSVHLGLFAIPYTDGADLGISPLGGQLFIPKKAKHLEETKKFLDFLASRKVGEQIVTQDKWISNFSDINTPELPKFKEDIVDTYMKPNKTTLTMDAYMSIELSELVKGFQDMYAGAKSPKEVYAAWDKKFDQLMKDKKMPGFD